MIRKALIVLFLIFSPSILVGESNNIKKDVYGELDLQNIYRDVGTPADGERFFQSLTHDNAYNALLYLKKELSSCQEMMKKKGKEKEDLEKEIGMGNNYYRVLFTLMKQNYLINKLEYNIAEYKYKLKEINEVELMQKKEKYKKAKNDFEKEYNSVSLGE